MLAALTLVVHSDVGKPIEKKAQSNEVLNITEAQKGKLKRGI
jgi:hypothetical protein